MNISTRLRRLAELGIATLAITTLTLAGCGGGSAANNSTTSLSGIATTFAGIADSIGLTDGASSVAQFVTPSNIANDGTYLYVTDPSGNNIRRISISAGTVSTFAGSTTGASGVTDATGTSALFNDPFGIATDGTNLYVADCANNNIRKIVISSRVVTTFAGSVSGAAGSTDATGTSALFDCPMGITRLGSYLYVADANNQTIRSINLSTGAVATFAGTAGVAGYSTGASGTGAMFNGPSEIATDGSNLFVADCGNNNVRQINVSTQLVSTLAGSSWINASLPALGINGSGSTDGTGTAARFYCPQGLAADSGNLYVSDTNNHTIRKIVISSGVTTTLAGSAGTSGTTNGTGSAARFHFPSGLSYLGGKLYVADWSNATVRSIR